MHAALTEKGWHVNILEDTAHKTHTHTNSYAYNHSVLVSLTLKSTKVHLVVVLS